MRAGTGKILEAIPNWAIEGGLNAASHMWGATTGGGTDIDASRPNHATDMKKIASSTVRQVKPPRSTRVAEQAARFLRSEGLLSANLGETAGGRCCGTITAHNATCSRWRTGWQRAASKTLDSDKRAL